MLNITYSPKTIYFSLVNMPKKHKIFSRAATTFSGVRRVPERSKPGRVNGIHSHRFQGDNCHDTEVQRDSNVEDPVGMRL